MGDRLRQGAPPLRRNSSSLNALQPRGSVASSAEEFPATLNNAQASITWGEMTGTNASLEIALLRDDLRQHPLPEGPSSPVCVEGTRITDIGAAAKNTAACTLKYMRGVLNRGQATLEEARLDLRSRPSSALSVDVDRRYVKVGSASARGEPEDVTTSAQTTAREAYAAQSDLTSVPITLDALPPPQPRRGVLPSRALLLPRDSPNISPTAKGGGGSRLQLLLGDRSGSGHSLIQEGSKPTGPDGTNVPRSASWSISTRAPSPAGSPRPDGKPQDRRGAGKRDSRVEGLLDPASSRPPSAHGKQERNVRSGSRRNIGERRSVGALSESGSASDESVDQQLAAGDGNKESQDASWPERPRTSQSPSSDSGSHYASAFAVTPVHVATNRSESPRDLIMFRQSPRASVATSVTALCYTYREKRPSRQVGRSSAEPEGDRPMKVRKGVRIQDAEGATFELAVPAQPLVPDAQPPPTSTSSDDDDYEELKEQLQRHTKIGLTNESGRSVLLLAEDDVAGLWPFEIERASVVEAKTTDDEGRLWSPCVENVALAPPKASERRSSKSELNSRDDPLLNSSDPPAWPTGNDSFNGQLFTHSMNSDGAGRNRSRSCESDQSASLMRPDGSTSRNPTWVGWGGWVPQRAGTTGTPLTMSLLLASERANSPRKGSLPVSDVVSSNSLDTAISKERFHEALVTFNPKVRILDGKAPGVANLGAANLRRKIYRLEREAPVQFPVIKVEFVGTPRAKKLARSNSGLLSRSFGASASMSDLNSARSEGSLSLVRSDGGAGTPLERRRSNLQDLVNFGEVCPEALTYFPIQDLHLYQLFAKQADMLLIFRPVSPALPSMYACESFVPPEYCDANGIPLMEDELPNPLELEEIDLITTRKSRVRGKGIQVSLKSSPYPPIEGLIPVNPHLSKTFSEAAKKARALEDQLLRAAERNTGAKGTTASIMRRMQNQETAFGSSTAVAMREILEKITESRKKFDALFAEYHEKSICTHHKLAVSLEYIDTFNESQFLGTTAATWRGMTVYYRQEKDAADLEREGKNSSTPVFYARRKDYLCRYMRKTNELDTSEKVPFDSNLFHPVEILTHRSFIISSVSHRIEPDPEGDFIIGPDFDGLAYAPRLPSKMTVDGYVRVCAMKTKTQLLPSMGLVTPYDIEHILEMRRLTQWKQNHGYESGNLVKTQELTPGNYTVITPKGVKVLHSFQEIIQYYTHAWADGFPLQLNPNWRVVLSPKTRMPVLYPYGQEEVYMPIVDDCGMAVLKNKLSAVEPPISYDELKHQAHDYIDKCAEYFSRNANPNRRRAPVMYQHILVPEMAAVLAKKELADKFYQLRTWQLMPPFLHRTERNMFLQGVTQNTSISEEFESFRYLTALDFMRDFVAECEVFEQLFPDDNGAFTQKLLAFAKPQSSLISDGSDLGRGGKDDAVVEVDYLRPVVDETPEFFGASPFEPTRRLRLRMAAFPV